MYPLPHSRRRSPAAVSVAELVSLHATADTPRDPSAADASPVSVASLLRREGRGPHAIDPPLLPRGHDRAEPAVAPSRAVRKAGVAAGALFAVTAVFGATVLQDQASTRDVDPEQADVLAAPGDDGATAVDGPRDGVALTTDVVPLPTAFDAGSVLPVASGVDIGRDALAVAAAPGVGSVAADGRGAPAASRPVAGPAAPGGSAPGPSAPETSVGVPSGSGPSVIAPSVIAPSGPGPDGAVPVGPPGGGTPVVDRTGPIPAVPVPDLETPEVALPGAEVPSPPVVGRVAVPAVTVSEAAMETPALTPAADDGIRVSLSRTAVTGPDADVAEVDAGPVGLTDTAADLPDLAAGSNAPLLSVPADDAPEITVPEVTVSPADLTTPDLRLGAAVVEVPDLATPELSVPETPVLRAATGLLGAG